MASDPEEDGKDCYYDSVGPFKIKYWTIPDQEQIPGVQDFVEGQSLPEKQRNSGAHNIFHPIIQENVTEDKDSLNIGPEHLLSRVEEPTEIPIERSVSLDPRTSANHSSLMINAHSNHLFQTENESSIHEHMTNSSGCNETERIKVQRSMELDPYALADQNLPETILDSDQIPTTSEYGTIDSDSLEAGHEQLSDHVCTSDEIKIEHVMELEPCILPDPNSLRNIPRSDQLPSTYQEYFSVKDELMITEPEQLPVHSNGNETDQNRFRGSVSLEPSTLANSNSTDRSIAGLSHSPKISKGMSMTNEENLNDPNSMVEPQNDHQIKIKDDELCLNESLHFYCPICPDVKDIKTKSQFFQHCLVLHEVKVDNFEHVDIVDQTNEHMNLMTKCFICSSPVPYGPLVVHIIKKHPCNYIGGLLSCKICKYTFLSKNAKKAHRCVKPKKYPLAYCTLCPEVCLRSSEMRIHVLRCPVHLKQAEKKVYQCTKCDEMNIPGLQKFVQHMKEKHSVQRNKIDFRGIDYVSVDYRPFEALEMSDDEVQREPKDPVHFCPMCPNNLSLKTKALFTKHCFDEHSIKVDDFKHVKIVDINQIGTEQRVKRVSCFLCPETFARYKFRSHLENDHPAAAVHSLEASHEQLSDHVCISDEIKIEHSMELEPCISPDANSLSNIPSTDLVPSTYQEYITVKDELMSTEPEQLPFHSKSNETNGIEIRGSIGLEPSTLANSNSTDRPEICKGMSKTNEENLNDSKSMVEPQNDHQIKMKDDELCLTESLHFLCPICPDVKDITTKSQFSQHCLVLHQVKVDNFEHVDIVDQTSEHMNLMTKCFICSSPVPYGPLVVHIIKKHPGNYIGGPLSCKICNKKFPSKNARKAHRCVKPKKCPPRLLHSLP